MDAVEADEMIAHDGRIGVKLHDSWVAQCTTLDREPGLVPRMAQPGQAQAHDSSSLELGLASLHSGDVQHVGDPCARRARVDDVVVGSLEQRCGSARE